MDEFRRSLDALRMAVWQQLGEPRGAEASGSSMTIKNGVPEPLEDDVSARIEVREGGKVQLAGQVDAAKLWRWVKWIGATLAAGGGLAALIRALLGL